MRLDQKVIAITGAGMGLGRELALKAARAGASLALADLRQEPLMETERMAKEAGAQVATSVLDIADGSLVQSWVDDVIREYGHVDGFISNAGMGLPWRYLEATPMEDLRRIVDVNMWGAVQGTLAFLPHLKERPESSIVIVSSAASMVASANQVGYSMSKFGLRAFAEGLRMEMTGTGVRVLLVLPGAMLGTDFMRNAVEAVGGEAATSGQEMAAMPFTVTAEKAAAKIVGAIQRNQSRITIGMDAAVMSGIVRMFPSSYIKILQPLVAKYEKTYTGSK